MVNRKAKSQGRTLVNQYVSSSRITWVVSQAIVSFKLDLYPPKRRVFDEQEDRTSER